MPCNFCWYFQQCVQLLHEILHNCRRQGEGVLFILVLYVIAVVVCEKNATGLAMRFYLWSNTPLAGMLPLVRPCSKTKYSRELCIKHRLCDFHCYSVILPESTRHTNTDLVPVMKLGLSIWVPLWVFDALSNLIDYPAFLLWISRHNVRVVIERREAKSSQGLHY